MTVMTTELSIHIAVTVEGLDVTKKLVVISYVNQHLEGQRVVFCTVPVYGSLLHHKGQTEDLVGTPPPRFSPLHAQDSYLSILNQTNVHDQEYCERMDKTQYAIIPAVKSVWVFSSSKFE